MPTKKAYSFQQDITALHQNVDLLSKDCTPVATERCCTRIKAILDRILENRQQSYVPYDVKEYFRGAEED